MSDVTLTAATKTALVNTLYTVSLADKTRLRLASGLKVNSPSDNAPAFFQAQALTGRAASLLAVKGGINQGLSSLGGAQIGLDAIAEIAKQLKGLALSARNGTTAERQALAVQFDALRGQIDSLAADAGYGGVNLLKSPPDDLSVSFNAPDGSGGSGVTVAGVASDAASLGIGTAQGPYNNFATDADINNALAQLDRSIGTLNATASTLGSNASLLTTRLDFTAALTNSLQTGADKLVLADLNEEAAKLVSLKLTSQLSLIGLNIANENQKAVLKLL
ncbi:MAG: flagellin [Proteobacteria bacterium]|nr:flagellin [Pseudomonadota bacterium]